MTAITSLVRRANRELGRRAIDKEIRAVVTILTRSDQGLGLVAEVNGEVVGSVIAQRERTDEELFVRWLIVDADSRRQGVGTALMGSLEATPGVRRVAGMVDQEDPAAHGFWTTRGWAARRPRPGRRRELMGVELAAVRPEAA